jgi:RNA recognition motif-containing protein
MPATHYIEKRKKEIEEVDVTFGIRVDDIHPDITIEQIKSIFENFGEISSLYYPINLKEKTPRGFCIIRYLSMDDAKNALETMNDTNIGRGRNILVSYVQSKSYWSLDETTDEALKEQRKKL